MFIFAVGYGVGLQFVRRLGKEGPRQVGFALVVLTLWLAVPYVCAHIAGLDLGYSAGLYVGSQTISASIGVATDQINRFGMPVDQAKTYANEIAIGYAVTYIWSTIGSATILAQLGPKLIGVDLAKACREYEQQMGGGATGTDPGLISAYRAIEGRAYLITTAGGLTGRPVSEPLPGMRVFAERLRRADRITEADATTVLQDGDIVAFSGARRLLVVQLEPIIREVDDQEMLNAPAGVLDVFVTSTAVSGQILRALSQMPHACGIYLRKIVQSLVEIPGFSRASIAVLSREICPTKRSE